jgi:alkaline phosphatase D
MRAYETMRQLQPDFLIHSGDLVYADGPIQAEVKLEDGTIWKNLVTEEKSKVAETLDEFRGQYRYNMMDENVRRFNAEITQYVQWDDHEVSNNWFWERRFDNDDRYKVKSGALLAARARRAMFEFTPLDSDAVERQRVYRTFHRGPLLDVFRIDMRSYRSANNANDQTKQGDDTRLLGPVQLRWLKQQLLASRAMWKIIAADMPLGLVVWHDFANRAGSEALAQGDGPPLGRELEFADLLSFIKRNAITNVHFVTADVHYCATHRYAPDNARFTDFKPFFEFVSGPIHAGGYGPNDLDDTFGPEVMFTANPGGKPNTPPTSGGLYFGHAKIDGRTKALTVSHRNVFGEVLSEITLEPEGA